MQQLQRSRQAAGGAAASAALSPPHGLPRAPLLPCTQPVPAAQHTRAPCPTQQQQQQQHSRWQAAGSTRGSARIVAAAAASDNELWTPDQDEVVRSAMGQLGALVEALPELPDEVQGALAMRVPGLLGMPAAEVRERLEQLSAALGLDMLAVGRLISKVPLLWNRSPEAAAAKLSGVADAIGIDMAAAAALFVAVPTLAAINLPGVVKDRVDAISDALGVPCAKAAVMIGRQPMLWVIDRGDVRTSVPALASALGLQQQQLSSSPPPPQQQQQQSADAAALVERMPVLLACETSWLKLNVTELCSRSGLSQPAVIDLLSKYPALAAISAQSVLAGLEELSAVLEAPLEVILGLVTQQPTLLLAKPPAILGACDVLSSALQLPASPAASLQLLARVPALLYDITLPALAARLEQLAVVLACTPEEARDAALQQPALLVVPPSALQSALASAAQQVGGTTSQLQQLLLADPGALLAMGYMEGPSGVADTWAARLGMDPQAVSAMVAAVPALLDLSPNTLRARLESLAALLDVPAAATAQLLLKHPALAAIPPNVTITRAKQLSLALRCSMARAAELIAKVPVLLLLPSDALGPGSLAGTPVDIVLDICATYEWYTSQWLMAAAKERQPQTMTSFAAMHS